MLAGSGSPGRQEWLLHAWCVRCTIAERGRCTAAEGGACTPSRGEPVGSPWDGRASTVCRELACGGMRPAGAASSQTSARISKRQPHAQGRRQPSITGERRLRRREFRCDELRPAFDAPEMRDIGHLDVLPDAALGTLVYGHARNVRASMAGCHRPGVGSSGYVARSTRTLQEPGRISL